MEKGNLLKNAIKEKDTTITKLANKIGLTREGLTKKINGTHEFKASEIVSISKELKLTTKEREEIFFKQHSE